MHQQNKTGPVLGNTGKTQICSSKKGRSEVEEPGAKVGAKVWQQVSSGVLSSSLLGVKSHGLETG